MQTKKKSLYISNRFHLFFKKIKRMNNFNTYYIIITTTYYDYSN